MSLVIDISGQVRATTPLEMHVRLLDSCFALATQIQRLAQRIEELEERVQKLEKKGKKD
jgi:polyhydroxyalkanoate synthesis regulator phasin